MTESQFRQAALLTMQGSKDWPTVLHYLQRAFEVMPQTKYTQKQIEQAIANAWVIYQKEVLTTI